MVEVEMDAKVVLGWLSGQHNANRAHFLLITDCRKLIEKIPKVKMLHSHREGNQCADKMARISGAQQEDFRTFTSPRLTFVFLCISTKLVCTYHERLCSDFVP